MVNWLKKLNNKALSAALILNVLSFSPIALPSLAPVEFEVPSFEEFLQATSFINENSIFTTKRVEVVMTAYSSTPDQTDDTPFITAMGSRVRDGIVAANFLPFGTRIMIPDFFGDKVFVVEDRMHRRFSDRVDIWFADRASARHFGIRTAEIVILNT